MVVARCNGYLSCVYLLYCSYCEDSLREYVAGVVASACEGTSIVRKPSSLPSGTIPGPSAKSYRSVFYLVIVGHRSLLGCRSPVSCYRGSEDASVFQVGFSCRPTEAPVSQGDHRHYQSGCRSPVLLLRCGPVTGQSSFHPFHCMDLHKISTERGFKMLVVCRGSRIASRPSSLSKQL